MIFDKLLSNTQVYQIKNNSAKVKRVSIANSEQEFIQPELQIISKNGIDGMFLE